MAKEIMVFVMSTFSGRPAIEYNDKDGIFSEMCEHTNEAALKYVSWKLKQENENLAAAFGFVTDEAQKDFARFQGLFTDYSFNIEQVPLYNNGDMTGSFKSICEMFDVLQKYIGENEEVIIHIDITGGPRHSVMLMLALIQMIKFSGAKVGMVVYANVLRKKSQSDVQKGMIEDVGDIMDMFTLISGAEEFASIGNVSQIQKYFEPRGNISWCLNSLLDCMENFSETIKVCGSYDSMKEVLSQLKNNITSYENFLKANRSNLCEQELFFGKLLPKIKNEYADIMPHGGKAATPVQIIRWCAKRKFLQQAVVFYTEWLPDYLIDSKLVEVMEGNVSLECEKHKMDWSSWKIYLFKSYIPPKETSTQQSNKSVEITADKLNYEDLRKILTANLSVNQIAVKVRNKNKKFEAFIENLKKLSKKVTFSNFAQIVKGLSEDDPIKIILKKSAPKNTSFNNYLDKRIRTLFNASDVVLAALLNVSREDIVNLFDLEIVEKEKKSADEKGQSRKEIFEQLLQDGILRTKLPKENLLQFVAQYNEYVGEWRNKFSHAVSEGSDKEKNMSITQAILDSIALIDVKK
ncbi:TM1812 family CRISPR-associated protein [Megamonas hypermegale]|uniref:TM1812 family CRISPR-associated protein n=1 Tax=Megamonas hypermegale TaxID=158847 RepID=UPI0026F21DCF|nr:TM1812 family CRISPR-associated protein [Megamonas hypermegale]